EQLLPVVAAILVRVHEGGLELAAEGPLLVGHHVADPGGDLVLVREIPARLALEDEFRAPVPAGRYLPAEEELRLDRVRLLLEARHLEVERRVPPDPVPVGERPAHLELLAVRRVPFV